MDNLSEMLKGVLEGMVLTIIGRGEVYGYQIVRQLNELGFVAVVEGTVYAILMRLEKNRLVSITKRPSEIGPMRKFYSLNQAGQAELDQFWHKWDFISIRLAQLREGG